MCDLVGNPEDGFSHNEAHLNIFQWRRFNFFDKETVKDPETSQVFDKLKVSWPNVNMPIQ